MFKTAEGVTIPFPNAIKQQYQVYDNDVYANVSFENLKPLIEEFYNTIDEPMFLALHVPLSQKEEQKYIKDGCTGFHEEIFYLNGCTRAQINFLFQTYGEILLNDGMSKFAIASHKTKDEIFVQKYKVVTIYGQNRLKYISLLEKYNLTQTDNLKTVWDTFSEQCPGECRRIFKNGKDIYSIVDELKQYGLYSAKVIKDY